MKPERHTLFRLLGWTLAAAVLATAFGAYLQPAFMLDLGTRIISCF